MYLVAEDNSFEMDSEVSAPSIGLQEIMIHTRIFENIIFPDMFCKLPVISAL